MMLLHEEDIIIPKTPPYYTSLTGLKLLGFWVLRTSFLLVNIRANLVKKIKKEESLY
jgi:hypothetical protein